MLIIAPVGEAEPQTYTCGVCGFVMNEVGECPRCRLAIEEGAAALDDGDNTPGILDQVGRLLTELDGEDPPEEPI